jgi:hypothetical protein
MSLFDTIMGGAGRAFSGRGIRAMQDGRWQGLEYSARFSPSSSALDMSIALWLLLRRLRPRNREG